MISRPVPAPRTREGKQVAKHSLERVTAVGMTTEEARRAPAKDLNLSALISEVERDIWLLEQLENNSSKRRQIDQQDDLPFPITEEILSLPGYKPKIKHGRLQCA